MIGQIVETYSFVAEAQTIATVLTDGEKRHQLLVDMSAYMNLEYGDEFLSSWYMAEECEDQYLAFIHVVESTVFFLNRVKPGHSFSYWLQHLINREMLQDSPLLDFARLANKILKRNQSDEQVVTDTKVAATVLLKLVGSA